ncbi:FG-nucleoporin nsp1 [Coemansia sp. Benny D115]|nr:FG-nucleoporin nsp1 [Coemansia sp. Benny D115]
MFGGNNNQTGSGGGAFGGFGAGLSFGAKKDSASGDKPATPTFSGFGTPTQGSTGSGTSLFGAKTPAASGDAPKLGSGFTFGAAASNATTGSTGGSLFGSSTTAASKPDAPKPGSGFTFGASTTGGGAASSLFGGSKPAASSSTAFPSISTPSTTSAAPAAAAAATPTSTAPTSLFGNRAQTSVALGSSGSLFGGSSLASTSAAATSAATSAAGASSLTSAASNPVAGTGFGGFKLSATPVVSEAKDDKKADTVAAPAASTASASTSAAPSAAPAAKADADKKAEPAKIENSTELVNAALRGKTLEEIAQMWTAELTTQTRAFHTQANTVSYWDRALVQQGKRITELYEATMAVEAEQAALDQSLEHMEGQQNALQALLDTYEGRVQDIVRKTTTRPAGNKGVAMTADEERDHVYSTAERLNMQLDEITRRLTALVEDVNGISNANAAAGEGDGQRGSADPFAQIVQILNAHLTSLEWVDSQTTHLQERAKNAQRVLQEVNSAQASIAGAYSSSAPLGDGGYDDDVGSARNGSGPALTIPGAFNTEPAPPVNSSFGTPMNSARRSFGSSALRTSGAQTTPFSNTPFRR